MRQLRLFDTRSLNGPKVLSSYHLKVLKKKKKRGWKKSKIKKQQNIER